MKDDILNAFLEIGFKLHLKETKVMTETKNKIKTKFS